MAAKDLNWLLSGTKLTLAAFCKSEEERAQLFTVAFLLPVKHAQEEQEG